MSQTLQETVDLLSQYQTQNPWIIEKIDQFVNNYQNLDKPVIEELCEELVGLIEIEIGNEEDVEEIEEEKEIESVEVKISNDVNNYADYHWSHKRDPKKSRKLKSTGIDSVLNDDTSFSSEPESPDYDGISYIEQLSINEDPYEVVSEIERRGRKNPPINLTKYPDLMMELSVGIGVDVARYGDDRTVIVIRQGIHIVDVQSFIKSDVMQTAGWVCLAIKEWKPNYVSIDITGGLGAGVYDRLIEMNMDAVCEIFGVEMHSLPPNSRYKAADMRTELAMEMAKRFSEGRITYPANKMLADDTAFQSYEILSNGKFRLVSKDKIKKKLKRSPDVWEAAMLSFWEGPSYKVY